MSAKVLLIDDDVELGRLIDIVLRPIGVAIHQAYSGLEGLRCAYALKPDLVILDVTMPEMDGFEVCARLREMANMPILMLTARTSESHRAAGFRVGINDFISKPFSKNELEARVRALLRRATCKSCESAPMESYHDSVLEVDLTNQTIMLRGDTVKLSPREFALLTQLMRVPGRIVSYSELIRNVWGEVHRDGTSALALYICHLRKKLQDGQHGHQYIRTDWGRGYWFEMRSEEGVVAIH